MTTIIRLALCVLILAMPARLALRAADPPAPATQGHVLVLTNENTFEGEIERMGDQYRIRRATGGETWVPGDKVLRLCATLEEAYEYLKRRANLHDPDERLRLAHWCQAHQLRQQALVEVTAAVALRPEHADSRRLLNSLQRSAATAPSTQAAQEGQRTKDEGQNKGDTFRPLSFVPCPLSSKVELNAQAVGHFATRVQPILMNACASCHASGRTDAFKLTRAYEGGMANRKTLQQNLAAVLAQINPDQPQASPFLTKAVSVHGDMAQAPLKGRQAPAYRTLEEWVLSAVASNPQLHERSADVTVAAGAPKNEATTPKAENPVATSGTAAKPAASAPQPPPPRPPTPPAVAQPAEPVDEFDPLIFNRQFHPERRVGSAAKRQD